MSHVSGLHVFFFTFLASSLYYVARVGMEQHRATYEDDFWTAGLSGLCEFYILLNPHGRFLYLC